MSGSGFGLWIGTSVFLALVALGILWVSGYRDIFFEGLYVLPAALLGSFIGSEGFKDNWGWLGSERGPQIGSFYVVTGLILGAVITFFAALASVAPAPGDVEVSQ